MVRAQWGFSGIVVNDWCCLYAPKVAKGGVTLEMPEALAYGQRLKDEILDPTSEITEKDVDQCLYYYLYTLNRFGMLEKKRIPAPIDKEMKLKNIPLARKLASRGAVLLKNDGTLPLDHRKQSIAVIGPTGRSCASLGGEEFMNYVLDRAIECVKQAQANMVPAKYEYGETNSYINTNRDKQQEEGHCSKISLSPSPILNLSV